MQKYHFIIIAILILLLSFSCDKKAEKSLILKSEQIITHVPSASGIILQDDHIWMIGDDASFLFELGNKNEILNQYQVSFMNRKQNGRLLKSIKPDFESMDLFDNKLLIVGSGSQKISRDTAVLFDFIEKKVIAKTSFRPLYKRFLDLGGFDSLQSINIEGLASDEQHVFMMHRGNISGKNLVFQMKKQELLEYIQRGSLPDISLHFHQLPKIEGYTSGFSGACLSLDKKHILFTSSVEATNDVYHDGEVLGSFIGIIPIKGENAFKTNTTFLLTKNDSVVKTKLESIYVKSQIGKKFEIVCVSDNDNGKSGIYKILLDLNE